MMDTNDLLKQGVAALKAGQKAKAYRLLKKVTQQDKDNETAWLWMSGVANTDRERIRCLREVLRIKPDNSDARRGLEHLEAKAGTTRPAKPKRRSRNPVAFLALAVLIACAVMCAWMKADIDKRVSEMPLPRRDTIATATPKRKEKGLEWKVDNRNEDLSRVYVIRGQRIEIMEPYDDMINKLGPPLDKNTESDPTYPGSWIAEFIYEDYTCLVCRSGERYYVWDIYPNK